MLLREVEPRAVVILTIMSLAMLSVLRRGSAFSFRSSHSSVSSMLSSSNFSKDRGNTCRCCSTSAAAAAESTSNRKGPEGTTLPSVMHRVVGADELKAELIIVGDVHGCYGEMVSLLERCGYRLGNRDDRERFTVVLAGDLVNKGPRNPEVVRTAREEGFLAVRGNHDNFILSAATGVGKFSPSAEPRDGGEGRLKSPAWVEELSSEDLEWLCALPYTLSFPSLGCIVVHAGLVPGVSMDAQDPEAMSSMRNVVKKEGAEEGYEPRIYVTQGVAWAKAWPGPDHVYFGHDAVRGFQKEAFATGLDTGCVYGKSLTAVMLPGGRVVCVPAEATWSDPGGGKKNQTNK